MTCWTQALADRGVDAGWVCWDDLDVDWAGADLVAVRSHLGLRRAGAAEFLAWAPRCRRRDPLLNGADVFAWNVDKALPDRPRATCPSYRRPSLDDRSLVAGLARRADRCGTAVVKPAVGAGGVGVGRRPTRSTTSTPGRADRGAVGRPAAGRVGAHHDGEISVFVIGGHGGLRRSTSSRPAARSGCTSSSAAPSRPVALDRRAPRSRERGDRGRRGLLGRRARLRPGRHDALRRPPGRQRARADRAGPLPRRAARQRRSRSPTWWSRGSPALAEGAPLLALAGVEC